MITDLPESFGIGLEGKVPKLLPGSDLHLCTSDNRIFEYVAKLVFTPISAGRLYAYSAADVASDMAIKHGDQTACSLWTGMALLRGQVGSSASY